MNRLTFSKKEALRLPIPCLDAFGEVVNEIRHIGDVIDPLEVTGMDVQGDQYLELRTRLYLAGIAAPIHQIRVEPRRGGFVVEWS